MPVLRRTRSVLVTLACIGIVFPGVGEVFAAQRATAKGQPSIWDVELSESGMLRGRIVDGNGRVISDAVVAIDGQGNVVSSTVSRADGEFALRGLKGGVYLLVSRHAHQPCRCWAANTAPPGSRTDLLLVSDETVVRGQQSFGQFLFSTPVLAGLFLAAVIAIPIAIHNSQQDAS